MSRPKNGEAFEKPPALATRSSVKEHYVAPEFRSGLGSSSSTVTDDVFEGPSTSRTSTTTTTVTVPTAEPTTSTTLTATDSNYDNDFVRTNHCNNSYDRCRCGYINTSVPTHPAPGTMTRVNDSSFVTPQLFHGMGHKDADSWFSHFEKYTTYQEFTDQEREISSLGPPRSRLGLVR